MKEVVIENDFSRIELVDGIVIGVFTVEEIDEDIVRQVVSSRVELCNGTPRPMMVDMTKVKKATKGARDFLASEEASEMLLASALVVGSPLSSFLVNFFMRINIINPLIPLKVFPTKEKSAALKWLEGYL